MVCFKRRRYKISQLINRYVSRLLLVSALLVSLGITLGTYIPITKIYAVSNESAFEWIYYNNGIDGQGQRAHSLANGTGQLKVSKCNNYTNTKKATVILRKASNSYPYYKNCGSLSFYKTGTYSFGAVSKGSYWLYVTGGLKDCYKTASGKVQNK